MPAHQQYFEVLGLDAPPSDRKAVKRAYSKMLKVTRPEDDPDGFMRLRDAHDQALNILRWRVEDEALQTQAADPELSVNSELYPIEVTSDTVTEAVPDTSSKAGLTYGDMLPAFEPEPISETSYSIGPTPNFDAPVTTFEAVIPQAELLIEDLNLILADAHKYNNREQWNFLFRKARQLDIDDYVDFEQLLMNRILRFHGYFDEHPHHDTPEKMPQKFSPSITASLFKTMSWDQVSKLGYIRGVQIQWLERRMNVRKRGVNPVPIPETESGGNRKLWIYIFGFFVLIKIIQAMANL